MTPKEIQDGIGTLLESQPLQNMRPMDLFTEFRKVFRGSQKELEKSKKKIVKNLKKTRSNIVGINELNVSVDILNTE